MNAGNPKKDPLKALGIIGRLEVGPVLLKPRGMAAPYRVTKNGEVHPIFYFNVIFTDPKQINPNFSTIVNS